MKTVVYGMAYPDYHWHIFRNGKMLKKRFWYRDDAIRYLNSKKATA